MHPGPISSSIVMIALLSEDQHHRNCITCRSALCCALTKSPWSSGGSEALTVRGWFYIYFSVIRRRLFFERLVWLIRELLNTQQQQNSAPRFMVHGYPAFTMRDLHMPKRAAFDYCCSDTIYWRCGSMPARLLCFSPTTPRTCWMQTLHPLDLFLRFVSTRQICFQFRATKMISPHWFWLGLLRFDSS